MKKTLKFAAIALSVMALTVACKSAPEATEDTLIDTTPIEEIVEDTMPMIDTVEVAPAEPVKKATPKTKKAPEQKAGNNGELKMEIKADGKAAVSATAPEKKK